MHKVLSFSLFDKKYDWQFLFYLRTFIFNVWMARIVYPSFTVTVHVERTIYLKYRLLLDALGVKIVVREEDTLCAMMMWRCLVVFDDSDYVFCRDADALVTKREADNVAAFIKSGKVLHGIHDNRAHSIPLLGGLCGFKSEALVAKYGTWENMIALARSPIDKHGSDQYFLNDIIYNDFNNSYFSYPLSEDKDGSDLCIAFVGAAGVNEMETLRYLRDKGVDLSLGGIGAKYPNVFYWL